jgi:hypothetical protein
VVQADRSNAGIVDFLTFDFSGDRLFGEWFEAARAFSQQPQTRAGLPCSDRFKEGVKRIVNRHNDTSASKLRINSNSD